MVNLAVVVAAICASLPDPILEPCRVGWFKADDGQCAICPVGKYGLMFVDHLDQNMGGMCLACPRGKFGSSLSKAEQLGGFGPHGCRACASGRYQPAGVQGACDGCTAGRFGPETGSGVCVDCPPGTFQCQVGQAACARCPSGKYGALASQSNCTVCAVGKHVAVAKQTSCVACPVGKHQPLTGRAVCLECPRGKIGQRGPSSGVSCDSVAKWMATLNRTSGNFDRADKAELSKLLKRQKTRMKATELRLMGVGGTRLQQLLHPKTSAPTSAPSSHSTAFPRVRIHTGLPPWQRHPAQLPLLGLHRFRPNLQQYTGHFRLFQLRGRQVWRRCGRQRQWRRRRSL